MKLLCVAVALLATTTLADPFVRELSHFQTASGGFHELGSEESDLESTSNALFLSALYGQGAQINLDDTALFIQSLASSDGSYSIATGKPADLEATRFALLSYLHTKKDIPEQAATTKYILSLLKMDEGLFELRSGSGGDIKATALAIESLSILGDLPKSVQDLLGAVKQHLTSHIVDNSHFVFDAASTTPLSDNYYGIFLAQHAGLELSDKTKWASYIKGFQNLQETTPNFGGFSASDKTGAEVTAEATAHAVMALNILGDDLGNERALTAFTMTRKANLRDTALTHLAFAHSPSFQSSIRAQVVYVSGEGQVVETQVTQGTKLVPLAFVSMFDGNVPHGGFDVSITDGEGWQSKLEYSASNTRYIAGDEYECDELGQILFKLSFQSNVYPVGDMSLDMEESKMVGFQVNLEEKAEFGGRSLEEGEAFSPGTEVSFELTFSTQEESEFYSGDFMLDFSVLDASNVVQYSSTIDGSANNKPISLSYTVSGADFPAGNVVFRFDARNTEALHTRHEVTHTLEQQMVAADIDFAGKGEAATYLLGDTLKVSMQPAVLKDLHTITPFSSDNAATRSFVMDLVSAQGTTYASVEGVPVEGGESASYEFTTDLPASLDPIGQTTVAFRFVSAAGASLKLNAFDTEAKEMSDDMARSQFTVNAALQLDEVEEEPSKKDFTFGSTIPLKFKLRDTVSNKFIGSSQRGSVAIVLRSGEGASAFESLRNTATPSADSFFSHQLHIDANAAKGSGEISIVATGVDGQDIAVLAPGSKNSVRYSVNVGGDIAVEKSLYTTTSLDITKTSFVSAFSLSCDSKALTGANLIGSVLFKNGSDFSVLNNFGEALSNMQAATNEAGEYSFSVSLNHDNAPTGQYKLRFVRQVDDLKAQATGGSADPLFEIEFSHKKVEKVGLWMQMEIALVLVLGTLFVGVSSHIRQFDNKKRA